MSLLDDVSIVVTPNGYKAGELYAVVPVPTEGAEEVTNGDFSGGSTGWTLGLGWNISSERLNINTNDGTDSVNQSGVLVIGKRYKMTLTSNITGTIKFESGEGTDFLITSTDNSVTHYFIADKTQLKFRRFNAPTIGYLDNISVKEYTSADIDVTRSNAATREDEKCLVNYAEVIGGEEVTNGDFANGTTDWSAEYSATLSIVSGQLKIVGGRSAQGITTIIGKTYSISANITNIDTVGGIRIKVSNNFNLDVAYYNSAYNATTTPVLIESIFTATATTTYVGSDQNGTSVQSALLDNISVKEVTRDNVPRIDYTGGGCPHILAEPQRTNEVTYSEDFSNSYFQKIRSTISTDQIVSPNGTQNADKFIEDSSNNTHLLWTQDEVISIGNVITWSVFAKKGEREWIMLRDTSAGSFTVFFDLENGVIGTSSGVDSSKIEDYGSGWYRCSITYTSTTTTARGRLYLADSDSGESYQGNGTSGLYIWGAQLEEGSYPTSYIPTSGSTVTRNQDIFTRDGIGSLINSTEGVLFVEMAALSDDGVDRFITLSDGGLRINAIRIYYFNTGGFIFFQKYVGGTRTTNINTSSYAQTSFNKLAIRYNSTTVDVWANGVKILTNADTNAIASGTFNSLKFSQGDGTNPFYGKVKQLQVYKTALTDNQLIQLTGEAGTHFFESYAEMASALTYTIQ
jgi:hypothetical protein